MIAFLLILYLISSDKACCLQAFDEVLYNIDSATCLFHIGL